MIILEAGGKNIELVAVIEEKPVRESSNTITIGGNPEEIFKSQRLEIELRIALRHSDTPLLDEVLNNISEQLYFTPDRVLIGKTSIQRIKVNVNDIYDIDERLKWVNDWSEESYFIGMSLNEVLF